MESILNESPAVESDIVGTATATVSRKMPADRSAEPDSGTDEKPTKKQKRDPESNGASDSSSKRGFSILEGFSVKMRNLASKIDGFGSKVAAFCGFSALKTESAPRNNPEIESDIIGTIVATAPREMDPSDETEPMNHADNPDDDKQSVASESNEAMDTSKNGENRFKVIKTTNVTSNDSEDSNTSNETEQVNHADDQDNAKQTTEIEKRYKDPASSSKGDMRFGVCVKMTEMDWFDIPVYIFGMYRRTGTAIMNVRQNIVWQEGLCRQLMLVVDGPAAKYITDEDDYNRRACRADNSSTSSTSSGSFSVDELGGTLIIRVIVMAEDIKCKMVPDTDYNLKHLDVHMKDADGNLLSSELVTASPTDDVSLEYVFEKYSKPTALTESGGPTVVRTLLFEHPKTKLQLEIDLSPLLNQIRDNAQDYLYYYTTTVDSDDSDSSNSTINSDDYRF